MRKALKYIYVPSAILYFIKAVVDLFSDFSGFAFIKFLLILEVLFIIGYLIFEWIYGFETGGEIGFFDILIAVGLFIVKSTYVVIAFVFAAAVFFAFEDGITWELLLGIVIVGVPIVLIGIALFVKDDE